jgi:hypothetical protein
MDATTFDTLIKRLATTPLTRVNVLRGLAASAAALTGVMLPKEAGAKKKDETEIKVCNCPGSDASSCKTQKKDKSKAKKLLRRNPCAYKGKCQGVSGCAAGTDPLSPPPPGGPPPPPGSGPPCTSDGDCATSAFCQAGTCVPCSFSCSTGQRCVHGTCTCDQFNNTCPNEVDGQCTCAAFVSSPVQAGCTDRNSACDLDKPCDINDDCPVGSVCLLGCADPPATNPRRCSKPCTSV